MSTHPVVSYCCFFFLGFVKHFPGAITTHWTTENKTECTRVSLDFRLIPGPLYHSLRCGGKEPGGQLDVYRNQEGYYSRCTCLKSEGSSQTWRRDGPLLMIPDARVGFPWTVKSWSKFFAKTKASS